MRAFPAMSAAISNAEPAKLARFLSPSFTGHNLDWSKGTGPETEGLKIRRVVAAGDSREMSAPATAEQFVRYVMELRSHSAPGLTAVVHIYTLTQ